MLKCKVKNIQNWFSYQRKLIIRKKKNKDEIKATKIEDFSIKTETQEKPNLFKGFLENINLFLWCSIWNATLKY